MTGIASISIDSGYTRAECREQITDRGLHLVTPLDPNRTCRVDLRGHIFITLTSACLCLLSDRPSDTLEKKAKTEYSEGLETAKKEKKGELRKGSSIDVGRDMSSHTNCTPLLARVRALVYYIALKHCHY